MMKYFYTTFIRSMTSTGVFESPHIQTASANIYSPVKNVNVRDIKSSARIKFRRRKDDV